MRKKMSSSCCLFVLVVVVVVVVVYGDCELEKRCSVEVDEDGFDSHSSTLTFDPYSKVVFGRMSGVGEECQESYRSEGNFKFYSDLCVAFIDWYQECEEIPGRNYSSCGKCRSLSKIDLRNCHPFATTSQRGGPTRPHQRQRRTVGEEGEE